MRNIIWLFCYGCNSKRNFLYSSTGCAHAWITKITKSYKKTAACIESKCY